MSQTPGKSSCKYCGQFAPSHHPHCPAGKGAGALAEWKRGIDRAYSRYMGDDYLDGCDPRRDVHSTFELAEQIGYQRIMTEADQAWDWNNSYERGSWR